MCGGEHPLSFVSPSKSELDSTPCEKNACALPLCLICILEIFRRGLNRARLQRDTNDKGGPPRFIELAVVTLPPK